MTKKKEVPETAGRQKDTLPVAYYRMNALLHTIRCIAQHEDHLCTLMHEIKEAGHLGAEVSEELGVLLAELPAHDYLDDLSAAQTLLAVEGASSPIKRTRKERAARAVVQQGRAAG